MDTDHTCPADTPIDAIKNWQEWYRNHRIVTEVTASVAAKDPQDPLPTSPRALTAYCKTIAFQKAKEYFSDTIAEFANELSGKELYKAFYAAATENMDAVEKEYQKAKQLVDMLRFNNVAP